MLYAVSCKRNQTLRGVGCLIFSDGFPGIIKYTRPIGAAVSLRVCVCQVYK